ncbi:predicted protein [Naegleria gruberi]|uniref:Predicted protein n=1 Tax=Naegleria gruberi TaxID=5762 RepID=D2W658_NAEGR|nr:uncharacterized protein NAEGRDRAFT_76902 [Naegleria gruberi]EFC35443.1 predicted protein [Naegleria gruberi]|eukprot:XP_002668187.1 predicted protein [Naegleria gruberi strain NEG-M]
MSFQQENKENMEEFMLKRKDIMERLTEPFQLTEKLIVTFELQDYIGDLSHFWKIFQITNSFCAHCMSNYPKLKFIQEKTKQRRSISTLIADSSNKTHGVGISLLNCFGEYEKNCNATTTCDVLHTLKGSIEEIINLLENIDGIDHEMITEIQQEVLQKGDVSILSGGHTRLFLLNYQKWIPQLSNLLKENSDISQRRKQIYERFEYGKDNLEWILFLMSLISKMAYRSEYNKKPYEVAFIETLTCLLYISLKSRYGDEFMTKHFHGLLIHFPQDFERTFQRLCSCERGEFLISILKRVSLTESNRSQDNALLAMVLSVTAHLERLLSGEKDNYVDNSKMFDNIDISDCNFVISGNVLKSKYLPELEWFLEYLKSKKLDEYVKVERNQQKIITSIEFCFSNEWEFCSLDCNSLIYDSARAPIVDAAENNSNREKCQCGKPCNQNCTSNIVKHCNKCCHIQQYQDSSNRKDCKAHRISKKEFVEKYLVSESEGMKAINSKKAKERKIKDQLNEIAVRLKSELEKEEESTHKRRKNDESFQKRKKSKKENSILDVNNSKSNDLIVNNLISSQNHTQTTNSTQLTLSADTEINSQPNFSQSQHQESQIIDTGTTKNTSSRRKGRRK